jgi:hypothetical protein
MNSKNYVLTSIKVTNKRKKRMHKRNEYSELQNKKILLNFYVFKKSLNTEKLCIKN